MSETELRRLTGSESMLDLAKLFAERYQKDIYFKTPTSGGRGAWFLKLSCDYVYQLHDRTLYWVSCKAREFIDSFDWTNHPLRKRVQTTAGIREIVTLASMLDVAKQPNLYPDKERK